VSVAPTATSPKVALFNLAKSSRLAGTRDACVTEENTIVEAVSSEITVLYASSSIFQPSTKPIFCVKENEHSPQTFPTEFEDGEMLNKPYLNSINLVSYLKQVD